jgi:sporulation protein YlmC with PRC-barrel domain
MSAGKRANQNVATRGKLVGKQVYNPKGVLVGTVQEVVLPVGEGEISLQLLSKYENTDVIAWKDISAVGDIVILKKTMDLKEKPTPVVPETITGPEEGGGLGGLVSRMRGERGPAKKCPSCGNNLRWIKQYKRWYCDNDGKYA